MLPQGLWISGESTVVMETGHMSNLGNIWLITTDENETPAQTCSQVQVKSHIFDKLES